MPRRPLVATVLAAAAIFSLPGAAAGSAPAAAPAATSVAAPAAAATDDDEYQLMLVLDASGSMAQRAPDGRSRIADARRALNGVIDDVPAQMRVGLRVFGATVFSRNKPGACTDTQAVVAPGTDNRDRLHRAVAAYKPYGETPIPAALRAAARDLDRGGQRSIILVSDGESTCGDPCPAARAINKSGIDVRIDVVGLDVNGATRRELKCIAMAGHGLYADANGAADLGRALGESATRAARPFDLTGTPVDGAPGPEHAPMLATGRYLDTVPRTGAHWYRVARTTPGSTIHVGVTHFSRDWGNAGDKLALTTYADPHGASCGTGSSFPRGSLGNAAALSWSAHDDECNSARRIYVEVEPITAGGQAGKPVEVDVYEEPPLAHPSADASSRKPPKPAWHRLRPHAPGSGIVPGSSLASAPVVADGSYTFDIVPGETQVVAVPLDWGQNLQAQLDGRLPADGSSTPPQLQIAGPLGAETSTDFYGTDPDPSDWTPPIAVQAGHHYRTGAQTLTTAYANRDSTVEQMQGSSMPGLRYVEVSYPDEGSESGSAMDYTLTIATNGTAGTGAPTYAAGPAAPAADSAFVTKGPPPSSTAPSPSDTPSSAAPSSSTPTTATKRAAPTPDGGGAGGSRTLVAVGAAAVGAGLVAAVVVLLRRRRS